MLSFLLSIADERDHDKIAHLYQMHHKDLVRIARHRLRVAGVPNYYLDSEDVVQEAFRKLIRYAGARESEMSEEEMYAMLMNLITFESKRFVSERFCYENLDDLENCVSDTDFYAKLRINERCEEVMDALRRLESKYFEALYCHIVFEMNPAEIAALMNISVKTVYTRIERGKVLLLNHLEKRGRK